MATLLPPPTAPPLLDQETLCAEVTRVGPTTCLGVHPPKTYVLLTYLKVRIETDFVEFLPSSRFVYGFVYGLLNERHILQY